MVKARIQQLLKSGHKVNKMDEQRVKLIPLQENDRERFILDNQEAFRFGALEEFGLRDDHFEEEGKSFPAEQ